MFKILHVYVVTRNSNPIVGYLSNTLQTYVETVQSKYVSTHDSAYIMVCLMMNLCDHVSFSGVKSIPVMED